MLFPRARRFEQVYTELAGADLVMYVVETERYHTFSNGAYEIWQAADGTRSEDELAVYVYGDCSEFSRKRVRVGLEQLAEADLLEDEPGSGFSRRQFAKLGAAAVLAGLPVVVSITAPAAADGLTEGGLICVREWDSGHDCIDGESCRCNSGCCCQRPNLPPICYDRSSCTSAGSGYSCLG